MHFFIYFFVLYYLFIKKKLRQHKPSFRGPVFNKKKINTAKKNILTEINLH